MRIEHPNAFKQFIENGVLATFRNYPYREGQVIRIYHNGKYVGRAVVEKVLSTKTLLIMDNIEEITKISGFNDLNEWISEAKKLHHTKKIPKYLVIIKRLER